MADSFPPPIPQTIEAANKINPSLGAQVRTAAEQMWGDPAAIRALSRSWMSLATRVDNTSKDLKEELRSLDQDWEGSAADAYKNWMQTLNDESIQALTGQLKQISAILDGTAEDVSAMNQEFTSLCSWFLATLLSLAASTRTGQLGGIAAALAGLKLADRIIQFQGAYLEKLHPRTQALRQIATEIDGGSIGRRDQHPPDFNHPFPYYTQEFADSYQWHTLGDWRNWKMKNGSPRSLGR
jgi:WXG100 family type VII secretion target